MLIKTRAIVFHQLKYSETSIIAKLYTEEYGLQSYLVKGARSKKSKMGASLFQPLSLVEIVAYRKEKSSLHHLKEIKSLHHFSTISQDIVKSSVCIFVNELVYRSIREEEANQALFEYLFNAIQWLDLSQDHFQNFHLVFALQLSRHLGFFPQGSYSKHRPIFNLEEGLYENSPSVSKHQTDSGLSEMMFKLSNTTFENMGEVKLNGKLRTKLAEKIAIYFKYHIANFDELKSLEVLKTILS